MAHLHNRKIAAFPHAFLWIGACLITPTLPCRFSPLWSRNFRRN